MHKDRYNKKLYLILAIILLSLGVMQCIIFFNISWDDSAIWAILYVTSTLVVCIASILLLARFFYSKKGEIQSDFATENSFAEIEIFNQLEEDLLNAPNLQSIYDMATNWLMEMQKATYAAFSIVSENKKLNVKTYCEVISSHEIFTAMAIIRTEKIDSAKLLLHDSGGFSVPFFKRGAIDGFVFIGSPQSGQVYSDADYGIINPFIRILSTAVLVADMVQVKKEKNQLQYAFSRYISPDMVTKILHNPEVMQLGGEKQNISAIFTDLRDFTLLSDSMDPVILVRVLNMYLNEMSEVIIALGGTIDKFEGDAILAFFGAPTPLEDHAVRCCRAALRMKKMEQILNTQLIAEKLIDMPLFTRFGINSGEMIVGNIGSLKRLDYTIIGSNVNIAARIETANKDYGTSILVSDQTWLIVKDFFVGRYIDTVQLKGVKRPIPLFELLSERVNEEIERSHFVDDIAILMDMGVQELFGTEITESNVFKTSTVMNSPDLEDAEELEPID